MPLSLNLARVESHRRCRRAPRVPADRSRRARVAAAVRCGVAALLVGLGLARAAAAQVEFPAPDPRAPIVIRADRASRWTEGVYDVWVLRGACEISQSGFISRGDEAVLWIDRREPFGGETSRVIAYLEGNVAVRRGPSETIDRRWFGRLLTESHIHMNTVIESLEPRVKPPVFVRGRETWQAETRTPVAPAQFSPQAAPRVSVTGIQIKPRTNTGFDLQPVDGVPGDQSVYVGSGGLIAIVEGVQVDELGNVGQITIETDRLVYWGPNLRDVAEARRTGQAIAVPVEVYLEGNVVFRQGDRLIYAERMYYNVTYEYGVVLAAEVYTPVADYDGVVRLKADVLHQLDRQHFEGYGAAITSSRLGYPRYWAQSQKISFRDEQELRQDPFTGQPVVDHNLMATAYNNFIYLNGAPVFYWPTLATNLQKPSYYIDRLKVKNDRVFGTQVLADLDAYQLLGIRRPLPGTDWTISTDYLSERGFGLGTNFDYEGYGLFGIPGPYRGLIDAWGIRDSGFDDLGANRRMLTPETRDRGRILTQHRQYLPGGFLVQAEYGWISDRNFLEQYFEQEWDEWKDQDTLYLLKRIRDNRSLSILGQARVNDFFTQTEWLPRVDHHLSGHSLLFDHLTWHEHTSVGYARLESATMPLDPADAAGWTPLAWEVPPTEGVRFATRHELDYPVPLGPVKLVPYALGELAYWHEDLTLDDVTRTYAQAGVRVSIPVWRADPTVQNPIFNLNGVAQKWVFDADLFWSDASEDLARFPLYDPLDDDSVEHFRRRFAAAPQFDERSYAFRTDLQRWVSSPATEIADDLMAARLGARGRWQTRRGLPGRERIVDWIELDIEGTLFGRPDRDNFGEHIGVTHYDFRWHLGDRLSLVSDGYADVFSDGLKTISFGGILSRPERGRLYVGFRSIEGPITSNVLSASLSYRMSEKWIADASTAVDFGPTGNIGQTLGLTRIGESTFMRLGVYIDEGRDNVGFQLALQPRFLASRTLGRVAGVLIPPAGSGGLE